MTARRTLQQRVLFLRALYRLSAARVMLISFPKSGRTWLRAMIGKALCEQLGAPDSEILKTYELTRQARLPLAEVTHDGSAIEDGRAYYQLPTDKRKYATKKVLFFTRDVRDVLVSSYFHATRRARVYKGSLSEFSRDDRYGARKILTFNRIWEEHCTVPRDFMLVRYEDLHEDPTRALLAVARFMGLSDLDASLAQRAVQFASFDHMRQMEASGTVRQGILRPGKAGDEESFKVRRGVVGGYRTYLSEHDIEYVDSLVSETGAPFSHRPSLVPRTRWDSS